MKRPFGVWVLSLIFIALIVMGWIRVQQAIQYWDLEGTLLGGNMPVYSVLSGALWGLVALPAVVSLWMKFRWVSQAVWGAALFYPLAFWLERMLVVKSPTEVTNWPFAAGITVLWVIIIVLSLNLRGSQKYLKGER